MKRSLHFSLLINKIEEIATINRMLYEIKYK